MRGGQLIGEALIDLTQQVLEQTHRRMMASQIPDDMRGLAVRIAQRRRADWIKKAMKSKAELMTESIAASLVAPSVEFWLDLDDALAFLADDARRVFHAHFFDGLNFVDAAAEVGVSLNEARKLWREATIFLRRLFSDLDE